MTSTCSATFSSDLCSSYKDLLSWNVSLSEGTKTQYFRLVGATDVRSPPEIGTRLLSRLRWAILFEQHPHWRYIQHYLHTVCRIEESTCSRDASCEPNYFSIEDKRRWREEWLLFLPPLRIWSTYLVFSKYFWGSLRWSKYQFPPTSLPFEKLHSGPEKSQLMVGSVLPLSLWAHGMFFKLDGDRPDTSAVLVVVTVTLSEDQISRDVEIVLDHLKLIHNRAQSHVILALILTSLTAHSVLPGAPSSLIP